MTFKKFLLNLTVGVSALLFGLAWVGVYQFFVGSETRPATIEVSEANNFDINNPESVLPIDFEEEKLTSPHVDETNEAIFDPEGYYFFDGEPEGFEDFFYINIHNKDFNAPIKSEDYGKSVPLNGHIILQDDNEPQYVDFEYINITDGKLDFKTKDVNGISYEFNGEFLIKGNFYTLDENAKVLEGTLVKKQNDKTVAKNQFTFYWTLEIGLLH